MIKTANRPSTVFYGPNRRYEDVTGSNVRVLATVFNLSPGDHWNPAWSTELYTPQTLVPHWTRDLYVLVTTNFIFALQWRYAKTQLQVYQTSNLAYAFRFTPIFGVHQWCKNEILDASGNYAFGGTATISWFKV